MQCSPRQMSKDPLREFAALRESMTRKKAAIEKELAAINAALGEFGPSLGPVSKRPFSGIKRVENSMSLLEAVLAATKAKPLSKREILEAVGKLGYKFAAKSPMNSLNTLLYSNDKIRNVEGKFGPK